MNLQEVRETLTKAMGEVKAQGYVIVPGGSLGGVKCRCALECLEGAPLPSKGLVKLSNFASEKLGIDPLEAEALLNGFDNSSYVGKGALEFYELGHELRRAFS